jgi:hypothetical protein
MTSKRKAVPVGVSKPPREYKVRLPFDLAEEIEEESERTGAPQNRIVVDRLERDRRDGKIKTLDNLIQNLFLAQTEVGTLLARYGARADAIDLGEELPRVVDEVLNAKPAELPAKLDKLRLVRGKMLNVERDERQTAGFIKAVRGMGEKRTKE